MTVVTSEEQEVERRARLSLGASNSAIYTMVARVLADLHVTGDVLLDVGCGSGLLRSFVRDRCVRYIGIDVVRYEEFPADAEFEYSDLNTGRVQLPDNSADIVVSVETIEHLENPRAFMRELARLAKSGGWVVITTPNQLSLLSLLTLIVKRRFSAFQDIHYPAHLTALLEVDLMRIAGECGLGYLKVSHSHQGRIVLTPWNYPEFLARLLPRAFSDNLVLVGRKSSE